MEEKKNIKVLVADDEKLVRDFLMRILSLQSVPAKAVEDGLKAIEAVKQEKFDLAFLDIRMPNMDGLSTYAEMKKISPELKCVFMTGYALEESLLDKVKQPDIICLKKPFQDIGQLKQIINDVLEKSKSSGGIKENIPERRAYIRLDVSFEVFYAIRDTINRNEVIKNRNISPGGIRFLTADEIAPGSVLDLTIRVTGASNFFKACAEVVWNKPSKEKQGYFDTGLKFKEINLSELDAFIKQYSQF